jgi:ribosomal protein S6--L-glutamate ligase
MNIVVLSEAPRCYATREIVEKGKKRGHQMTVLSPSYCYLKISERTDLHDSVYDGYGQDEKPVLLKSKDIDAVIPRIGANLLFGTTVLEHLTGNLQKYSTQTAWGILTASDKMKSAQKFSQHRVRTPATVLGDRAVHAQWLVEQVGNLPAIGKTARGSQGDGVYILKDPEQTNTFIQNYYKKRENLLIQRFINTGSIAKDVRVIIADQRVVVAMERSSTKKNEIRANISQGGTGKKIELSTEDQDLCLRAASAVGLSAAGVDLIKDETGKSYVVEINGNFGFKIQKLTGEDIATPLIQMCEKNYKSGNKANQSMIDGMLGFSPLQGLNIAAQSKQSEPGVNWNVIDQLPHNKSVDGFTKEEKKLTNAL